MCVHVLVCVCVYVHVRVSVYMYYISACTIPYLHVMPTPTCVERMCSIKREMRQVCLVVSERQRCPLLWYTAMQLAWYSPVCTRWEAREHRATAVVLLLNIFISPPLSLPAHRDNLMLRSSATHLSTLRRSFLW